MGRSVCGANHPSLRSLLTEITNECQNLCPALVDMSRAFLGIAAGNEMAEDYMNAVANDFGALLDWKSCRVRPTRTPNIKRG